MKTYIVTMKFKRETTGDFFDFLYTARNQKEAKEIAKADHPACTVVSVRRV